MTTLLRAILMVCLLSLSAPVLAGGPPTEEEARAILGKLRELGGKPSCDSLKFLVPGWHRITVDRASEGSGKKDLVEIGSTSLQAECPKLLLPLFAEGLFQSEPFCTPAGGVIRCTLATPTSLPRLLEFFRQPGGEAVLLSSIGWPGKRVEPKEEDDDDDDLPL
ncbi:MAG: hypothetical protein FJ098_08925 [Deltaproteobacteria bacterium]|nr:hypothetical protein [Deltaproteobacteria bacterium]